MYKRATAISAATLLCAAASGGPIQLDPTQTVQGSDVLWGGAPRITPLDDASTPREPALSDALPGRVVTRVGGRVRDRHAREAQFRAYQHYLPDYFESRTFGIEIDDTTPGGGSQITFTMTTAAPHSASNFRAFFRGINTVAEYHHNGIFIETGTNEYRASISYNNTELRPIRAGDLIEFEIGVFLAAPVSGRNNYYSRAYLYRAGSAGILPWQAGPVRLDSEPMPAVGHSGGDTTLSYNYSGEPEDYLIQMALNISGPNAQEFVEGRRLHHTHFGDGSHSEPGNPPIASLAGSLGPLYDATSCIACHERNGRNGDFATHVVKLNDHPLWGNQLQSRALGPVQHENTVSVAGQTVTEGQFDDGTAFALTAPLYTFSDTAPAELSVRMPGSLVGIGLLEAVDEAQIAALADPGDADGDGVSGRMNRVKDPRDGRIRMGRFGWKASAFSVRHQVARALAMDMGVTTSVFRKLDCGDLQGDCQAANTGEAELDDVALEKMVKYVALLGVPAQRGLDDPAVAQGRQLFDDAGCGGCHTPTLTTGRYHPYAELREQTIHPYTDLLLHDMGPGLADDVRESGAKGSEWRTAPLWGLGLAEVTASQPAYLHDGRAASVLEAVLWHGGEADASRQAVLAMTQEERSALLAFLASL